jgi:hypothetical protein
LLGQGRSGIFSRWAQKQEPCRSIFLTHQTLNLYVEAHQKVTERTIVAYLLLKEMSVREIHDDIVAILGPDAFDDADQLLAAIEGVLDGIEKVTLQSGLS